ncbi:hypothetical protein ACJRPK_13930 [Aquimarina sp. 2-A2]|uniref:hypothetical protein n=1 Tax=Aquimarina sp. 2-A2 TaxID=3382644 RepID=UPI00387F1F19
MENIDFVLWTVLYPVGAAIASYYGSKERYINGKEPYRDSTSFLSAIINFGIWMVVANALYN